MDGGGGKTLSAAYVVEPAPRLPHSQMDNGAYSRSIKIDGHEPIEINPQDAAARGLRDGDIVRVFNDRGSCLCGVVITDHVMQGVVVVSTGSCTIRLIRRA